MTLVPKNSFLFCFVQTDLETSDSPEFHFEGEEDQACNKNPMNRETELLNVIWSKKDPIMAVVWR